ncbi:MAG: hypothetical protein Q8P67_20060 [archaeon]|nr:hypothetical protein [archaeon]
MFFWVAVVEFLSYYGDTDVSCAAQIPTHSIEIPRPIRSSQGLSVSPVAAGHGAGASEVGEDAVQVAERPQQAGVPWASHLGLLREYSVGL